MRVVAIRTSRSVVVPRLEQQLPVPTGAELRELIRRQPELSHLVRIGMAL
jgi:hypothetical protein